MKCFLILILTLAISGLTQAQQLKICGVNWPPFSTVEKGQFVSGASIDIYKEAFRRLGMTFSVLPVPWHRCTRGVAEGVYDVVMDAGASAPASILFGNHATIFNPIAIFVRADSGDHSYDPDLLKNKLVGIPRDYASYLKIANQHGWKTQRAADEETALKMLNVKRFDYALLDLANTQLISKQLNILVKPLAPMASIQKLYLGFNKKHHHLLKRYDKVISEMIKEGFMDNIYQQYFSYTYSQMNNELMYVKK